MHARKLDGFNEYNLRLNYGELEVLRDALAADHSGPVADELYQEIGRAHV